MKWIDLAWPMIGGVSLTLGLANFLIWCRQRTRLAQLVFSLAAICVCVLTIFELLAMRATTPAQYETILRWAHVPVALQLVLLIVFVRVRFDAGNPWLGIAAGGTRVACLLPNFLVGANLNFLGVDSLVRVELWGGDSVVMPMGEPNPWMLMAQASNVLLFLFLADACRTVWLRRADADERRRALLVCGSMVVFVMLAAAWNALVVLGLIRGPMTVNFAFVVVVIVMTYELGGDVIDSMRLAQQLAESEGELRRSEQRMHLAAQAAGLALWTWDLESDESWFTEPGSARLGLVAGEHVKRDGFLARIHPEDRVRTIEALDEAMRQTGEYSSEYRLPQPDGSMRWLAAWGRVESTPSGEPRLMRGVIIDITDRRQAEERFRLVVDGAPTAMLMVDAGGRITLANARAERLFGFSRAELIDARIDLLIPARSRGAYARYRHDFTRHPKARALGVGRTLFGRCKDGSEVPVEIEISPIWISDSVFALASVTDISERLRSEHEAALQREELAHLSRVAMLGEISGSLAHELNQPLTAVLSNAQAALRFLQRDPPDLVEVNDCLVHVVENDKRAGEVIRRLRSLLRRETVNYQELDINEVVQDVARLLRSHVMDRNIDLEFDPAADLPTTRGDRVQLQQVLLNLLINACDAMEEPSASRAIGVRTRLDPGSGIVRPAIHVSISDAGRGIPPDDLERVFLPFVSTKQDGMGLGLAVCRTIITVHRGSLWATNNAGRGATLHFCLPASEGPAEPARDG